MKFVLKIFIKFALKCMWNIQKCGLTFKVGDNMAVFRINIEQFEKHST